MPGIPFTKDDPRINREGRPVGAKSFTSKVKEALEKIAEGKDYSYEEAFIKSILKKAIVDQDVGMMRTIWEQLDGKPLQRMANADGSNLKIEFSQLFNKNARTTPETSGDNPKQGEI